MKPSCRRAVRALSFAACFLLVTACGGDGPIDGDRCMKHVEAMVAIGPRPAGSEALQKNAEYLEDQLRQMGLEPHEQVWTQTVTAYDQPKTLSLRNVWTEIPGPDPEHGPIVLLMAHYDTKLTVGLPDHPDFRFVGAMDGAGGSAVLLELARALKDRQNKVNVWILWVDGEESVEWDWKEDTALLGSTHFAQTMQADKKRFPNGLAARVKTLVLLDLIGSKNFKFDHDLASSGTLLDIFRDTAQEMGETDRMYPFEQKMGADDYVPFKNLGVPVIDLIDFRWRVPAEHQGNPPSEAADYVAWWHTELDDVAQMSKDALAFAGNLVWNAMPRLEQMILQP